MFCVCSFVISVCLSPQSVWCFLLSYIIYIKFQFFSKFLCPNIYVQLIYHCLCQSKLGVLRPLQHLRAGHALSSLHMSWVQTQHHINEIGVIKYKTYLQLKPLGPPVFFCLRGGQNYECTAMYEYCCRPVPVVDSISINIEHVHSNV